MQAQVLRVIAEPQLFLWAPRALALMSFCGNMGMGFILIAVFSINPLYLIASIALIHCALVLWGLQNPHAATWLAACAAPRWQTRNLLPPRKRSGRQSRRSPIGVRKYGQ